MDKTTEIKAIDFKNKPYPLLLKTIPDPPKKIYLLGSLPEESLIKIAVVGTRKATLQGRLFAKQIAQKLTEMGIIVVSGLAMGIDTAAHQGAVLAKGKTIAVLANGLNSIYPAQNENLAKKILEFGGAIISEYPPDTPAYQSQFLERNRIVSGLCKASIIIEAPERSGSLVTARLAAEQGREVFVAPGPINHPNYRGSHKLIRDGARLITSIEDILEDLGLLDLISDQIMNNKQKQQKLQISQLKTKEEKTIFKILKDSNEPLNIDKIIKIANLEAQTANQTIAFLTIKGIIKETEKGYVIN